MRQEKRARKGTKRRPGVTRSDGGQARSGLPSLLVLSRRCHGSCNQVSVHSFDHYSAGSRRDKDEMVLEWGREEPTQENGGDY